MMNCKGFGGKRLPGGNEENYKKLSQYSLSLSRDLNPGPPKYESGSVKHSTTTLGWHSSFKICSKTDSNKVLTI
jgi:hypothetical protein